MLTPSGRPALRKVSHNKYAVIEVNSLGLQTQVHPAAIHGAIFQLSKYKGKFQGTIRHATPAAFKFKTSFKSLIETVELQVVGKCTRLS